MDCSIKIQLLLQIEKRKWVIMVGMVALTHLFCQSLMLPYGNALLSLLPNEKSKNLMSSSSHEDSSVKTLIDDNLHIAGVLNLDNDQSLLARGVKSTKTYNARVNAEDDKDSMETKEKEKMNSGLDGSGMDDDDVDFVEDDTLDNVNVDLEEGFTVENSTQLGKASSEVVLESKTSRIQEKNVTDGSGILPSSDKPLLIGSVVGKKPESAASISDGSGMYISLSKRKDDSAFPENGSSVPNKSAKRKMRCDMPPKTVTPINEMERLLVRHRARSRAMVCVSLDVCIANVFDFPSIS